MTKKPAPAPNKWRSGVNLQPRITFRAFPEEFADYQELANADAGGNLNQWLRDVANKEVKRRKR